MNSLHAKTHNPFRLTEQVNHNGRMKIWINLQALEIETDIQKVSYFPDMNSKVQHNLAYYSLLMSSLI